MNFHCDSFHSEDVDEGRDEFAGFLVGFLGSNQKCHFLDIIETLDEGGIRNLGIESAVIVIGVLGYVEYLDAVIYD